MRVLRPDTSAHRTCTVGPLHDSFQFILRVWKDYDEPLGGGISYQSMLASRIPFLMMPITTAAFFSTKSSNSVRSRERVISSTAYGYRSVYSVGRDDAKPTDLPIRRTRNTKSSLQLVKHHRKKRIMRIYQIRNDEEKSSVLSSQRHEVKVKVEKDMTEIQRMNVRYPEYRLLPRQHRPLQHRR